MSAPNEFVPPAPHAFHHENLPPPVIQAAHSNSNFPPTTNTNGGHFNGGGFFPNSIGYDVAMLPFLHHTPQRPAHFNTFAHQKQIAVDNVPKDDLNQITAPPDGHGNVFNTDTTNNQAYWSRQSQLSPFGVLPHEIPPEHVETDVNVLNVHYTSQPVNNISNHMGANNCAVDRDKKTQIIVSGKSKEAAKKYIPKSVNELKIQNPVALSNNYNHEDLAYRNGVINHAGQATMNKVNANYNKNVAKPANEVMESLQVNEPSASTVPRDYRVFKSPVLFANSSVPVVKFTGKPPKQYVQKQMVNDKSPQNVSPGVVKNHRLNANGSPSMIHKMSDFQDDAQSSPISLTSDDISDPRSQYPSAAEVVQHNLKDSDNESYHGMTQMNNITHTSSIAGHAVYREQLADLNCQDKNKVTPPFLKLPYTVAGASNIQNNVVTDRNRTSFPPLYIMYNNPPPPLVTPKRQPDKERVDGQQAKINVNMHTEKPAPQNGLVGYSSVIMRTDRNYEAEEKMEKSPRRMIWNDRQVPTGASVKSDKLVNYNAKDNAQGNIQAALPEHPHLLLGLTERQHSYFDNTPCSSQIKAASMNNITCVPKAIPKNVYDENQSRGQLTQSPETIHYQQYMPINTGKPPIPINQPVETPLPEPPVEKPYSRKRKSSKTNPHTTNIPVEYPAQRDPPPAHLNPYQQPLQNSGYVMEGARYEVPTHGMANKMYPNNEQFYGQANVNAYHVNVTQEPTHQHQTVISSHANTPRHSPSAPQLRNVPPIPPALPLSAYFSSFNSASPHYTPHHDFTPDSSPYVTPETHYQHEPSRIEKEVNESRSRVIVPNVEEEFRFLFDPNTPNYKQICWSAEEEELLKKAAASKSMFYRKNIDFLASYIKFLENNCESVETLTDANSSTIKTWNRNKVVYQPIIPQNKEDDATPVPPAPPKDQPKPKEPEINFENDPRYYPLPKSSDKRRLDSSSDESGDEFAKKSKPTVAKKSAEERKKIPRKETGKSEKKIKKSKIVKKQSDDEDDHKEAKTVKTKLEKIEKAKQKIAKLQMKVEKKKHKADKIKPKMEKTIAEMKAIKESGLVQKPKPSKDAVKNSKSVPRRKVSDRKAKDEVMLKQKIQDAIDSDDEIRTDSDSDPSWTPRADDEENLSKRKSTRIRSIRFQSKSTKKSDVGSFKQNFIGANKKEGKSSSGGTKESQKNSKVVGDNHKMKPFFILKKEASMKHPNVWRLQNENKLQKFQYFEQDGRHLYRNSSEFCKFSENDRSKYHEVEVTLIEDKNDKTVVELSDDTEIPTDVKIKENFMKESLCYEHQFAVYIQTLVSQALDSNFLSEIVKENDVYFLNNMKVIDEVTATYLSDLTGVVKWGSSNVNLLVKTWPFISIKNIRNGSTNGTTSCSSCGKTNTKQTAIFYGQPYQRETLQGCKPNSSIPNDLDKTVDLCRNCAREIKLFNRIWHQKYHVFVECAKYVSKKKSEDKSKGTTDILNELLADTAWLSKLFYDIRNTWLQIWTIVQKTKES